MNTNKPSTVAETYWIEIPSLYEVIDGRFNSFNSGSDKLSNIYKNFK